MNALKGLQLLPVLVLGIALLSPAFAHARVVDHPWGNACELDWCQESAIVDNVLDKGLATAADAARLTKGDDCAPASTFASSHPHVLPATMVVRSSAGRVTRMPWTYPAPAGMWTLRLCA